LVGDTISFFWPWEGWLYMHPICGVIGAIYGIFFISKQAGISKKKSALLYVVGMTVFIVFRMLFLG